MERSCNKVIVGEPVVDYKIYDKERKKGRENIKRWSGRVRERKSKFKMREKRRRRGK